MLNIMRALAAGNVETIANYFTFFDNLEVYLVGITCSNTLNLALLLIKETNKRCF